MIPATVFLGRYDQPTIDKAVSLIALAGEIAKMPRCCDDLHRWIAVLPLQDAADPSAWWQSRPGENQARTAKESYALLWESLHGAGSWDANPELVCPSFETHRRNIDQMEGAA